jgi:aldehyde:ferredoxin oxidoreductase
MPTYGGWTGKTLRVNLTTGKISADDTIAKYKDYVGGEGLGLKVLFDEVAPHTDPLSPENKLIIGAGPLNGTGLPHMGRLSFTSLLTTNPDWLPGTGHAGGHFTSLLKFAGWDSVIIEGKAPNPVWIFIDNENVSIRDARRMWGHGNYYINAAINDEVGTDCVSVLSIGQAGQNMHGAATVICDRSHSGQNGGTMGAKNLIAVAVRGTGSVKIACTGRELLAQIAHHTSLTGGTSGGMTPQKPKPWAQYYGGGDWLGDPTVWWGGADAPVNTGLTDPHDVHTTALRGPGSRSSWNSNDRNMKWMVRGASCFGCPTPCHQAIHVPEMATSYGYGDYCVNECGGLSSPSDYFGTAKTAAEMLSPKNASSYPGRLMGSILGDDYGIGDDYHILTGDFVYYASEFKGIMKANLPAAEYNSIPWNLQASGDPGFLVDIMKRFSFRIGELGYAHGLGSKAWWQRWGGPEKFPYAAMQQERGFGKAVCWSEESWFAPHHFEGIQSGFIINSMYNRDPCMHEQTHINSVADAVDKSVWDKIPSVDGVTPIGGDACDASTTAWNDAKCRQAIRLASEGVLHNSQVQCNRGGSVALWFSPLAERGYVGDSTLDAVEYSMVTGDHKTEAEMHKVGLRIFNLLRAGTIRGMGTTNMIQYNPTPPNGLSFFTGHDAFPDAAFNHPSWKAPAFSGSNQRMDPADMDKAVKQFYGEMGWSATGAPKKQTYLDLGMDDVAAEMERLGLLG